MYCMYISNFFLDNWTLFLNSAVFFFRTLLQNRYIIIKHFWNMCSTIFTRITLLSLPGAFEFFALFSTVLVEVKQLNYFSTHPSLMNLIFVLIQLPPFFLRTMLLNYVVSNVLSLRLIQRTLSSNPATNVHRGGDWIFLERWGSDVQAHMLDLNNCAHVHLEKVGERKYKKKKKCVVQGCVIVLHKK